MNIFVFADSDGDRVIVAAATALSAKNILLREFDKGNFSGTPFENAFTGTAGSDDAAFAGGTVEVPVDSATNKWTHKKLITPADTIQEGVLFEFD